MGSSDQIFAKLPGALPVSLHRDKDFHMDLDNDDVVTVWIALDDMDDEVGPLKYVHGSHMWEDNRLWEPEKFTLRGPSADDWCLDAYHRHQLAQGKELIDLEDEFTTTTVSVRKGGAGIHNGRLW